MKGGRGKVGTREIRIQRSQAMARLNRRQPSPVGGASAAQERRRTAAISTGQFCWRMWNRQAWRALTASCFMHARHSWLGLRQCLQRRNGSTRIRSGRIPAAYDLRPSPDRWLKVERKSNCPTYEYPTPRIDVYFSPYYWHSAILFC
jgi:hypothetical protein